MLSNNQIAKQKIKDAADKVLKYLLRRIFEVIRTLVISAVVSYILITSNCQLLDNVSKGGDNSIIPELGANINIPLGEEAGTASVQGADNLDTCLAIISNLTSGSYIEPDVTESNIDYRDTYLDCSENYNNLSEEYVKELNLKDDEILILKTERDSYRDRLANLKPIIDSVCGIELIAKGHPDICFEENESDE